MQNEIGAIREELGLSWAELGEQLCVNRTTVMRWEKGQWVPNETAMRLARFLLEKHRADKARGVGCDPVIGAKPTKSQRKPQPTDGRNNAAAR